MKKALLLLSTLFLIISCNNNTDGGYHKKPVDSMVTLTVGDWGDGVLRFGKMRRIDKDSFFEVQVDTLTKKKKWSRWHDWKIPMVDTVKGVDGKPLKDSLGRFRFEENWYLLKNPTIIRDFNVDVDSINLNYKPKN